MIDCLCKGRLNPVYTEEWTVPCGIRRGRLYIKDDSQLLPTVTSSDNGSVLTVSNGVWIASKSTINRFSPIEATEIRIKSKIATGNSTAERIGDLLR